MFHINHEIIKQHMNDLLLDAQQHRLASELKAKKKNTVISSLKVIIISLLP